MIINESLSTNLQFLIEVTSCMDEELRGNKSVQSAIPKAFVVMFIDRICFQNKDSLIGTTEREIQYY